MRIITVKVKPNSKHQSVKEEADGSLTIHLKSPPVDGKANAELIHVLTQQLGLPKSKIRIKMGLAARLKRVEIDD